ncbi:arsenic resistance protein [Clostridium sardiniense]|uniref:arsenic resistance protein n=1 Tax=Clostridium sardiniense TaxID=29369 RepID=UPI003D335A63
MDTKDKFQSLIIIIIAFIGIFIGQVDFISNLSDKLIMPFLTLMLFLLFLQIPFENIKTSLKNIKFTSTAIIINFIITPMLIFILGKLFLINEADLLIGFVMLTVTPCTDWYLIFTDIAKGNTALGASLLPLNFILQIVLLPLYVLLICGTSIKFNSIELISSTIINLIIPLILSILIRNIIIKIKGYTYFDETLLKKCCRLQGWFLNLAILSMFASQGNVFLSHPSIFLKLLIPLLLFFFTVFLLGQFIGFKLNMPYEDTAALNLTTLARNSPIALAIAVAYFSDRPMIAVALIVGPLIEIPVLMAVSRILLFKQSRQKECT